MAKINASGKIYQTKSNTLVTTIINTTNQCHNLHGCCVLRFKKMMYSKRSSSYGYNSTVFGKQFTLQNSKQHLMLLQGRIKKFSFFFASIFLLDLIRELMISRINDKKPIKDQLGWYKVR